VKKIYLALVAERQKTARHHRCAYRPAFGATKKNDRDKARGRIARTDYRVLQSGGGVSLIECAIHSGRTHQIRVHLHHIGHPVSAIPLREKIAGPRQMLHARKLGFTHPRTNERLFFEAPFRGFSRCYDAAFRPLVR